MSSAKPAALENKGKRLPDTAIIAVNKILFFINLDLVFDPVELFQPRCVTTFFRSLKA
jgi:hypothetical protein